MPPATSGKSSNIALRQPASVLGLANTAGAEVCAAGSGGVATDSADAEGTDVGAGAREHAGEATDRTHDATMTKRVLIRLVYVAEDQCGVQAPVDATDAPAAAAKQEFEYV